MKYFCHILLLALALSACTDKAALEPVDFSDVLIEDSFWTPRLDRHKTATIPMKTAMRVHSIQRIAPNHIYPAFVI